MIEEPPLLRIKSDRRRPSVAQIAAFQGVATGYVADAMNGVGSLSAEIAPLTPTMSVAGPALTAGNGPADIMATLAALNFVQEGDVLVLGASGYQGCAAAGDLVCGMLKNAGAKGLVTDGKVRDANGIEAVGLPVWSTGLNPASPFTTGPGTVGHPVNLGGQRVEHGDMIVADRDGVVVVPFDRIDEVIATIAHVRELEAELEAKVNAGLKVPQNILDLLESDRVAFD